MVIIDFIYLITIRYYQYNKGAIIMKKYSLNFISLLTTIILLICTLFERKYVSLGTGLDVSISLFIYPLTFLLTIIVLESFGSVETKKMLKNAAISIFSFFLIAIILNTISANTSSNIISSSLRNVLTPNSILISDIILFYPNLINFIGLLVVFILSHYIIIAIYDALKDYTNYFISFMIALLIAFIIDVMFQTSIMNIINIINNNLYIADIVKALTSSFVVLIITSLILIFIFPIFHKKD